MCGGDVSAKLASRDNIVDLINGQQESELHAVQKAGPNSTGTNMDQIRYIK